MKSSLLSLFIILISATTVSLTNAATKVKWTAATHDPNDEAATAPRSQRYWDKHNIKRPEYAKTDAEIRAERRENTGADSSSRIIFFLVLCGLGYAAHHFYYTHSDGGFREGGIRTKLTEEEERQARLARFENIGAKEE